MKIKKKSKPVKRKRTNSNKWHLRLYIAGQTERSQTAVRNIEFLCKEYIKGKYKIEIIDLIKNPKLAKGDQIFAIPTLIKKVPRPVRKIIGDLSDIEKVIVGLDLKSSGSV